MRKIPIIRKMILSTMFAESVIESKAMRHRLANINQLC